MCSYTDFETESPQWPPVPALRLPEDVVSLSELPLNSTCQSNGEITTSHKQSKTRVWFAAIVSIIKN